MNITLIALAVSVISVLFVYLSFIRARNLKRQLEKKNAKLVAMAKNLDVLRTVEEADAGLDKVLQKIDTEIVQAKTRAEAIKVRKRFVAKAYTGI